MLRDSDIDSLNGHLASLSREQQKQHDNLQDLLGQFKSLLDDYSSLKSDYEEVKEGREKYKRQARGQVRVDQLTESPRVEKKNENELTFNQDRNPFVLVLVDGDGYLVRQSYFPRYPLS